MKLTKENASKHISNKAALEHVLKCLDRGDELHNVTNSKQPAFRGEYVVTSDYGIVVRKVS